MDRIIAEVDFLDGIRRPVFERPDGSQYVIGYDGDQVEGVWVLADDPHLVVPANGGAS